MTTNARSPGQPTGAPGEWVRRYEELRGHALTGQRGPWRLGEGLLLGRGMAAWMRAWAPAAPASGLPQAGASASRTDPEPRAQVRGELVLILAAMALGARKEA